MKTLILSLAGWFFGSLALLVLGLVLTVLGLIGSVLGWKVLRWVWQGTGRWLRWQQRLVAGEAAVR